MATAIDILVEELLAHAKTLHPDPEYPETHKAAMQVPKGGSSCASCRFVSDDRKHCSNKYFIKWNGSKDLPSPADEYCSDWYEPREVKAAGTSEGVKKAWDTRGRGRKVDPNEIVKQYPSDSGKTFYVFRLQSGESNTLAGKNAADLKGVIQFLDSDYAEKFAVGDHVGLYKVTNETPGQFEKYRSEIGQSQGAGHADENHAIGRLVNPMNWGGLTDRHSISYSFGGKGYKAELVKRIPLGDFHFRGVEGITMLHKKVFGDGTVPELKGFGTSEGVTKAWDTRGRGTHDLVPGVHEAGAADIESLQDWPKIARMQSGNRQVMNRARKAANVGSWIADDYDPEGGDKFFVVDSKKNGVVGAVQVIDGEKNVLVEHLATRPDVITGRIQERGVGTKLMIQAAKYAASHGLGVELGALSGAEGFYEKLGMHRTEKFLLAHFGWTPEEAKQMAEGKIQ